MFLTVLLNNKSLIAVALLLAVIAGEYAYITLLKSEKDTLVAEKAQLQTLLEVSQANLKQLQSDIHAQNDAIGHLKKEGDARVAKGAVEVKKAQDTAAEYRRRSDDLLGRIVPQNVAKCDAANMLINEELQNARK
jgi:peptidoglycan hydrolase CwlO-like protein